MRITLLLGISLLAALSGCDSHQIGGADANERAEGGEQMPASRGAGPDADGDGWYASLDCDDTNVNINPGEQEVVNAVDDDCDGAVDCDDSSVVLTDSCYDADHDGACDDTDGDGSVDIVFLCSVGDDANAATIAEQTGGDPAAVANYIAVEYGGPPLYEVTTPVDCDDTDATSYPGAVEMCDSVDNDCNGSVDDSAVDQGTWYTDADGDTYGDPASSTVSCTAPDGSVADWTDCDDTNGAVNPGATEVCDGIDNDCNAVVDDSAESGTWYADVDGDTFGDPGVSASGCTAPEGAWVADNTDCDDAVAAINPGATELCNGWDDDCDGDTDNTAVDMTAWYRDTDGDAFGDPDVGHTSCSQPSGFINTSGDCDDGDFAINPDAVEIVDGADNDCNGSIDDVASGSCRITVDLFSGRSGPALTVNGSVSDDSSFNGSWIDGSLTTVAYTDTPLGGSDHQYTFELNHCLSSGEYILLDASWSDGKTLCNADPSLEAGTVYATLDSVDLTVGYYDLGGGLCELQIQ
ncbi:hypothetical protein EBS80_00025 [bacterium]|nr:hypothetical protein [bacterium]